MFNRGALICRFFILAAWIVSAALPAAAQDADRPSPAREVIKRVASDPTTYAAALLSAEAQHLDWSSSQVFFQHGFSEHNPAFTVSGRPDDTPLSYGAGNKQIVNDALRTLGSSILNNVAATIVERALLKRYPTHPTLIRWLGRTERIADSAWLSYREAVPHFSQWQKNGAMAQQLGY